MKRVLTLFLTLVVAVGLLAGCSAGSSADSASKSAPNAAPAAPAMDYEMEVAVTEEAAAEEVGSKTNPSIGYGYYTSGEAAADDALPNPTTGGGNSDSAQSPFQETDAQEGRKLIWRVYMDMETTDFDSATQTLSDLVSQMGGYLDSSSLENYQRSDGRSQRYASVVARIPSQSLDDFINETGALGNVTNLSRTSEDITLQYTDTESRKRSLEIEQERLMELLEQAQDLESIILLEERLTEVRYQLEDYTSTLMNYDNLVDYSIVSISIQEVTRITEQVEETLGSRISSGFSNSLYRARLTAENFIVFVASNLPALLFWGVIIAAVVILWRRRGKNRLRKNCGKSNLQVPAPTQAPAQEDSQEKKAADGNSADSDSEGWKS